MRRLFFIASTAGVVVAGAAAAMSISDLGTRSAGNAVSPNAESSGRHGEIASEMMPDTVVGKSDPGSGWSFNLRKVADVQPASRTTPMKSAVLANMKDASTSLAALRATGSVVELSTTRSSTIYDVLFPEGSSSGEEKAFAITATDLFGAPGIGFRPMAASRSST